MGGNGERVEGERGGGKRERGREREGKGERVQGGKGEGKSREISLVNNWLQRFAGRLGNLV